MRGWLIIGAVLLVSVIGTIVTVPIIIRNLPAAPRKTAIQEHITDEEKAAAAKIKPGKDPVQAEINAFRAKARAAFDRKDFETLEKMASEVRTSKALFRNGSWKNYQFYEALECHDNAPAKVWQEHEAIHQAWLAAMPQSITPRVAYAMFLTDYAWQARGSGYANTVSKEGWRLFEERLVAASKVLHESRPLPEKDPVWWHAAITVGLGQGWNRAQFEKIVAEAHAFEPKYWGYDSSYAYTLLPRWYGKPGDWEAFADQAAARPDGLGNEVYARIVINLQGFYGSIFRESRASWPKTRDGLEILRKKYPESIDLLSESAFLAAAAGDREVARAMFDQLGDTYLPHVWRKPERFVHIKHWAETGEW